MPLAISVAPAKPLCEEMLTKASIRPMIVPSRPIERRDEGDGGEDAEPALEARHFELAGFLHDLLQLRARCDRAGGSRHG